jgi:phosphatidylserine decarboxylase
MVKDGIYYSVAFLAAGAIVAYLAGPGFAAPLFLLAAFCAYFFRDPERLTPAGDFAISPADGKVIEIVSQSPVETRLTIFLNVFDVHVNRTPISGTITKIEYKKGLFLVASRPDATARNEQNTITVQGGGVKIVFSQIAGLIARRIVCYKKVGDVVQAGERIGLIKFGSRVDVIFGPEWIIDVKVGRRVSAGSSILARRRDRGQTVKVDLAPIDVEEGLLCQT